MSSIWDMFHVNGAIHNKTERSKEDAQRIVHSPFYVTREKHETNILKTVQNAQKINAKIIIFVNLK